jgi:hypothetical protein
MRGRSNNRLWVVDGVLLFVLVLWTAQLFLLISGLDAFLGGDYGILWPAAISSIVIAAICVRLVGLLKDEGP